MNRLFVSGKKKTPEGGIIDRENDIRLFCYRNEPYREAYNKYQFIFDYKGVVMNINIGRKIIGNDVYYSLIEIQGDNKTNIEDIKASLREAIVFYGNYMYNRQKRENNVLIHTEF